MSILGQLRLLWANKTFNYSVLMLFALLGVVIPAWYLEQQTWVTPLILGVIAAALAESDDSFTGRLKALIITMICFAIASFSIELLFNTPLFFAAGLFVSTLGFVLLGAIGPRYTSIAFGSLLVAIYTMLGASESRDLWTQPTLLLGGASWYYLVSLVWNSLWPLQPVQQSLSNVFNELSLYLDAKRNLFHPTRNLIPQPHRLKEASLNACTVYALNECKTTLLNRSKRGHVDGPSDRFLQVYFIAQDIHERVSSSHYRYQELASSFSHSDVLFRFKHLLEMQSIACKNIAYALKLGNEYSHSNDSLNALVELQDSIEYLETQNRPEWKPLLVQIHYLFNNLATVEKLLSNVSNPDIVNQDDNVLDDTNAHTPLAMWRKIKSSFTLDSLLLRHAIRLSCALTLGYGIIQFFELERGYWILLTTLFVCQPNYSATRQKLTARIAGTVVGLLVGVPLLTLFPSTESQLVLLVISGVMFFAFRLNNYGYATGFITVLVLLCFHQLGEGYAVVLPRLMDTLIGCALAVCAVYFILPDWESKRLSKIMVSALKTNRLYLLQIIGQYRVGKKDDLSYRIARRDAHNADANLSKAISNMLAEPDRYQLDTDECFRFLTLNHALLSYISALGAHRQRLDDESIHLLVLEAHRSINQHIEVIEENLSGTGNDATHTTVDQFDIHRRLSEWRDEDDRSARMVLQQLHLIYRMLPELQTLSTHLKPEALSQTTPES
ncbi:YccS family putative transporter [Vibrio maritimus]